MPTRRPIGQELRPKGHRGGAADRTKSAGTAYGRIREWEAASSISSRNRSRAAKAASAAAIPAEPMPQRDVPFFIQEAHEVNPGNDLDYDWTLRPHDHDKEMRLRDIRNAMIKELLLEGKSIAYRQSGWSLYPRIHSNDLTYYYAVSADSEVEEGDIVFCQVDPGDRYYAHLVKTKEWHYMRGEWLYTISNMEGRPNGTCFIGQIYGKLYRAEH